MKKQCIAALAISICSVFLIGCSSDAGNVNTDVQKPEITTKELLSEIDFTSLETEDLTTFYYNAQDEMIKRGEIMDSKNRIGRGDYEVGRDIRAGKYVFECIETRQSSDDTYYNGIGIFATENDKDKTVFSDYNIGVGGLVTLNLEDGMTLSIFGCSGTLEEANPSWAP